MIKNLAFILLISIVASCGDHSRSKKSKKDKKAPNKFATYDNGCVREAGISLSQISSLEKNNQLLTMSLTSREASSMSKIFKQHSKIAPGELFEKVEHPFIQVMNFEFLKLYFEQGAHGDFLVYRNALSRALYYSLGKKRTFNMLSEAYTSAGEKAFVELNIGGANYRSLNSCAPTFIGNNKSLFVHHTDTDVESYYRCVNDNMRVDVLKLIDESIYIKLGSFHQFLQVGKADHKVSENKRKLTIDMLDSDLNSKMTIFKKKGSLVLSKRTGRLSSKKFNLKCTELVNFVEIND